MLTIVDAVCRKHYDACPKQLNLAVPLENLDACRRAFLLAKISGVWDSKIFLAYAYDCAAKVPTSPADATAVKACVDAINATSCEATDYIDAKLTRLRGPCQVAFASMTALLRKELKAGDACGESSFCGLSGTCKITNTTNYTGVCEDFTAKLGDPCDPNDNTCRFPNYCADSGKCEPLVDQPLYASPGTLKLGQACDTSTGPDCVRGLYCDADTKTCKSTALGSACTDSRNDCFCRGGVCVQPKAGDACADTDACLYPQTCVSGKCTEPKLCGNAGAPCERYYPCAKGLACDNASDVSASGANVYGSNTCLPEGKLGDPCDVPGHGACASDLDCIYGSSAGTCVAKGKAGDACNTSNGTLASGACVDGLSCVGSICVAM